MHHTAYSGTGWAVEVKSWAVQATGAGGGGDAQGGARKAGYATESSVSGTTRRGLSVWVFLRKGVRLSVSAGKGE